MVERLPTICADRRTEPKKLGQMVRGELDWIVMKALEKDRTPRYETSNRLGRDVERQLRDQAVAACPPSATYRTRGEKVRAEAALGLVERRADEIRDGLQRLKSADALLDPGGGRRAKPDDRSVR